MKLCPRCQTIWKLSEFTKDSSKPDGLDAICKHCRRVYRKNNRIKEQVRRRRRYYKNPAKEQTRRDTRELYPDTKPCAVQGCGAPGERHHIDYNDPKSILWLCKKHHDMIHLNTI